jgi:hypothetical protein
VLGIPRLVFWLCRGLASQEAKWRLPRHRSDVKRHDGIITIAEQTPARVMSSRHASAQIPDECVLAATYSAELSKLLLLTFAGTRTCRI